MKLDAYSLLTARRMAVLTLSDLGLKPTDIPSKGLPSIVRRWLHRAANTCCDELHPDGRWPPAPGSYVELQCLLALVPEVRTPVRSYSLPAVDVPSIEEWLKDR